MRVSRLLPLFALLFFAALIAHAQRPSDADRSSKNGLTRGRINGVDVTINYGRPRARGRTIWGSLVPYDEVWRAGANEATTLSLSRDTRLEGRPVPAGTYSMFLIPHRESWTFVINKVANQWGAYRYDPAQDLVRFDVVPASREPIEEMTIRIDGERVMLAWGDREGGFVVGR